MDSSQATKHIRELSKKAIKSKVTLIISALTIISGIVPFIANLFSYNLGTIATPEQLRILCKILSIATMLWIIFSILYKLLVEYIELYNKEDNITSITSKLVKAIEDGCIKNTKKNSKKVAKYISISEKNHLISQLLRSFTGDLLFKTKKNFEYDIVIEESEVHPYKDYFYKAFFTVSFEAFLTSTELIIDVAVTNNEFHEIYKNLQKKNKSIYRYILKSDEKLKLKDKDVFNLKELIINDNIELEQHVGSSDDNYMEIVCRDNEGRLDELKGKMVKYSLKIETIVDKRQNEFTIIFGYLVKNLNTSFTYAKTKIDTVDVIDMVTATSDLSKTPLEGHKYYGANTKLKGWMVPCSGVIYTWKHES